MKFHLFHEWSEWQITEEGEIRRGSNPYKRVGFYFIQRRVCKICGYTQVSKEEIR